MARPNERRKRRNRMLRVVRGNIKAGNPLPGQSRVYTDPRLDSAYVSHGENLRSSVDDALSTYWGAESRRPREKKPTNRWF